MTMVSRFLTSAASKQLHVINASRVTAPAARVSLQRIQSRQVHTRLELPYDIEKGLGEFLPPAALKVVAVEYQQGLLDRLNEQVAETAQSNRPVVQTVIDAAQDPSKVLMFNYASEALNNSFFLSCLRPLEDGEVSHEKHISLDLQQSIRQDFGSLEQLKSTFGAAVQGMFGTGWVWLLTDQQGRLAVYPTFGHGTLLIRSQKFLPHAANTRLPPFVIGEDSASHDQRSHLFSSTPSSPVSGASRSQPPLNRRTQTRTLLTHSPEGRERPRSLMNDDDDVTKMGDKLFPLFCISVHEHAWLSAGYGVWGKEEWVKRFWSVVHWEQASAHFSKYKVTK